MYVFLVQFWCPPPRGFGIQKGASMQCKLLTVSTYVPIFDIICIVGIGMTSVECLDIMIKV
jgi:hypothetical protein